MRTSKQEPGRSLVLIGADRAGNVVGVGPHKRTLTAIVVDGRGGVLAGEHFRVSGDGHRALEAWALSFGAVARWGVENAAGWGRHTAIYLVGAGHDVRDVCPNRTACQDRGRQRGKSDALDAERIARETLSHPLLPHAFKRAQAQAPGPDEHQELLGLRHKQRRSLLKSRQHLLNEAEFLLAELPLDLREQLPDTKPCARGWPRWRGATAVRAGTLRPRCAWRCSTTTAPRSRAWTPRSARSPSSWGCWSPPPTPPWRSSAACRPAQSPSCSSRSATRGASPRAASRASTAQRPWRPPRPKGPASPSVTASTGRQPPRQRHPAPNGRHPAVL